MNTSIFAAELFVPFTHEIDTTGYPSGNYVFYVEYKSLDDQVIQTASVEFKLK